MVGTFILLGVGIAIASLVLLLENMEYVWQKSKRLKTNPCIAVTEFQMSNYKSICLDNRVYSIL